MSGVELITVLADEAGRAFRDRDQFSSIVAAADKWVEQQGIANPMLRAACRQRFEVAARSHVPSLGQAEQPQPEPTNPQSYQCAGCETMVDGRSNLCLPCTNQAVQEQPDHSGLFLLGLREPGEMGRGEFSDEMYRQGDLIAEGLERSLERWKPGDRSLFYAYMVGRLKGAEIHAAHEQTRADNDTSRQREV